MKSKTKTKAPKQEQIEVEEETKEEVPQLVVKDPYGFDVKMANKWYNKQRVLLLCSRGVSSLHRHLFMDLFNLFPHAKKEVILKNPPMISPIFDIRRKSKKKNCHPRSLSFASSTPAIISRFSRRERRKTFTSGSVRTPTVHQPNSWLKQVNYLSF